MATTRAKRLRKAIHKTTKGRDHKTGGRVETSDKAPMETTQPKKAVEAGGHTGPLDPHTIRIRMYRVGFGDCFLVSLPIAEGTGSADSHQHILVDCGVHWKGDIGTLERVIDNIAAATGKRLAIVVATHAHQDHISGFDRFGDQFSTFKVGEVWLPWTWDPNNQQAVKLQKKHFALADQLAQHFAALGAAAHSEATQAVANLQGNAHAITLLKSGFGVTTKVHYMKAGDNWIKPEDVPVPGLSVRVLGPPQSEEFLAQMDPPAGQHYLRGTPDKDATKPVQPFSNKWIRDRSDEEVALIRLSPDEEKRLHDIANTPLDDLAFALDQARNNESLVLLLIFRGQYLLFPGDAQYGNWRWWLENEQPADILPQIRFFKVAHHGSVNATPKSALEQMSDGKFAAMVSTQSTPWKSIPRVPLMARLSEKTKQKIVRSDWLEIKGAPKPLKDTAPTMPSRLPEGFSKGDPWIDYLIRL